jgi:hypothetical protein
MSWTTPRTTWGVDGVGNGDFNRIEENIAVLHKGNGQEALTVITPPVASPYNLDFPNTTDQTYLFTHTGNKQVGFISTLNRQPGNVINMIMNNASGNVVFLHDAGSADAGYAKLLIYVGVYPMEFDSVFLDPNRMITFVFSGSAWFSNFAFLP